jgi:hypothetical protein
MRERRKRYPRRYPKWPQTSALCRKRAGDRCEFCGVAQWTLTTSKRGKPCLIYLVASHIHRLDPEYWRRQPINRQRLRCLCPTCHGTYDAEYRRREQQQQEAAEHRELALVS